MVLIAFLDGPSVRQYGFIFRGTIFFGSKVVKLVVSSDSSQESSQQVDVKQEAAS